MDEFRKADDQAGIYNNVLNYVDRESQLAEGRHNPWESGENGSVPKGRKRQRPQLWATEHAKLYHIPPVLTERALNAISSFVSASSNSGCLFRMPSLSRKVFNC